MTRHSRDLEIATNRTLFSWQRTALLAMGVSIQALVLSPFLAAALVVAAAAAVIAIATLERHHKPARPIDARIGLLAICTAAAALITLVACMEAYLRW